MVASQGVSATGLRLRFRAKGHYTALAFNATGIDDGLSARLTFRGVELCEGTDDCIDDDTSSTYPGTFYFHEVILDGTAFRATTAENAYAAEGGVLVTAPERTVTTSGLGDEIMIMMEGSGNAIDDLTVEHYPCAL